MNPKAFLAILACQVLPCSAALGQAIKHNELRGQVLLFAAASTTEAMDEIRAEFERLHPAVTVRTSYAASSALARQIEAGARADVFLSANTQWIDFLKMKRLVARSRSLLGNRLVIIIPADSPFKIDTPSDLAQKSIRRIALADPQAVPAGIYARQALEKLKLWESLRPKVAGAADVRQALKFVETGAAEAGIVYATDAAAEQGVRIALTLDPELSEPIRYPVALLTRATNNAAAVTFYEFLASKTAATVFVRHGFVVPDDRKQAKPQEAIPCGR
jgi:molybdate transport system substrate-binding protein